MNETPLTPDVVAMVNNLTEHDFSRIREDLDHTDTLFRDELGGSLELDTTDIESFKNGLLHLYLPYYAEKLREYIALKPSFFIVDGTSAIPHAYVFKAAFREYQSLHPDENITIPEFLFIDAHPLREHRGSLSTKDFTHYIDTLKEDEFESVWGIQGGKTLRSSLAHIHNNSTATAIVFDEFSDPTKEDFGSLKIIARFITSHAPGLNIFLDSPKTDDDRNQVTIAGETFSQTDLIGSYHIWRPLKRIERGSGNLRRPSLLGHPLAHARSIEFIRECRQLGRLIANAA